MLVVLKAAVTPEGMPEAARFTLPLKPVWPFTPIVVPDAAPPPRRERLLADEERVNPGWETIRITVVVFLAVPEVPVIVTG